MTPIRFHLDEHVAEAIARGLRQRGIEVTTTQEAGLLHASDEAHVEFALGEGRVIYTNDADFLAIHHRGFPHAGIAYCSPESRSIGEVLQGLELIFSCLSAEEMVGRVEYL